MRKKEKVIIRRTPDYNPDIIKKIIQEGLSEFGLTSKVRGRITIKPNVVMAHSKVAPSSFTRSEFLDGLLCALMEEKKEDLKIVLAEKSGAGLPTARMFRRAGYHNLKKKHKIKLLPIEESRKKTVRLQNGEIHEKATTAREILENDLLLYAPKLKGNVLSQGLSAAIKLNIGLLLDKERLWNHNFNLDKKIADLLEVGFPDFIATDAIEISLGGNQLTQHGRHLGIILMATNPLAHDAVCAHILHLDPQRIQYLCLAHERGYGPLNLDEIDIEGDISLEEVRQRTKNWDLGLVKVDKVDCNIKTIVGQPYCAGGCHGIFLDWLYMFKDRKPKLWKNLPPWTVVIGQHSGDVVASKLMVIGTCSEIQGKIKARKRRKIKGCPPRHKDLVLWLFLKAGILNPLFRFDIIMDAYFFLFISLVQEIDKRQVVRPMNGRLLIENRWVETKERIKSFNPATLESVGEACLASAIECQEAIEAAKKTFPLWKGLSHEKKSGIFKRAKKILLQRSSEVAHLLTVEKGSPLPESLSVEVQGALEALDYYGRNLRKSLKSKKTKHHVVLFSHKRSSFHFHPLGVTLIISPWNFPFLIPFCDILAALAAGNTTVFRPSTSTPLVGLLIGDIFVKAGLPPGVLNIVNCKVPQAEDLILSPDIQTIMFTGSVPTGKRIMELASRNLTNIVLELGGKDPMIVLKDADLERASKGAVWAAFMNTGQSCASVERVYADREIAAEFMGRVLDHVKKLKVGNPLDPEIDMGPVTVLSQLKVVEEHIEDAVRKGARVLWGGKKIEDLSGYFFPPTVLSEVNHSMKIMQEETFGPVLPIMTFSEPEEAISLANDSLYGLTASIWTRSKKMACWMAERIEAGTITVNDHMFSFIEPGAIWGGVKQTGKGYTHGQFGLQKLMNIKFISLDLAKKKSQIWWYPYSASWPKVLEKSLVLFHHDRFPKKIRAAFSLISYWSMIKAGSPVLNFIKSVPKIFRK